MNIKARKYRIASLVFLLVLIPLGLYTKIYEGPGKHWVNYSAGGILYELFWCVLIACIWINMKPVQAASYVFILTCFLEFLQLWHPPFLELLRSTFLGRTLLGTTFTWCDFFYYVIGSGAGAIIVWRFKKIRD